MDWQGDMFTVHSIACLSRDWSTVSRLLFYTITPALLVLVLAAPILVASLLYAARRKADSDEFKRLTASFFTAVRALIRTKKIFESVPPEMRTSEIRLECRLLLLLPPPPESQ